MSLPGLILLSLLAGAGFLYLLAGLALFLWQGRLLFVPNRVVWRTPAETGLDYEDIFLDTADGGRIHGWFIPAPQPIATILYCHGNAGNIAYRVETAARFHEWGLNVFLIDYRGYGNSSGRASEKALYRDVEAAWKYLVDTRGIPDGQIIVIGRSLGSAVAAHLAARVRPAGVVLETPFLSLPAIAAHLYPWFPARFVCRFTFPTDRNTASLRCPVLIAHSREDELIPFRHAEALYDLAPEPKFFAELCGRHNDCISATGLPYEETLRSFIERCRHPGRDPRPETHAS
jgi:uncharacterized protein